MNDLYGTQSHIPMSLLNYVAKNFKGFINIALNEDNEQVGHIVFIPLNRMGYNRMIDPEHSEEDLNKSDIFNSKDDQEMCLFVYSIYSLSYKLTKRLINETIIKIESLRPYLGDNSIIFTEVVTNKGGQLARRMSLEYYYSYNYQGETLNLYKSSIHDYLKAFPY